MGRRPRAWQCTGLPSVGYYGLATIFVAGLVFVDSFQRSILPKHHLHSGCPGAPYRATSFRGQGCNSCRAKPRDTHDSFPRPALRRRTPAKSEVRAQQQHSRPCSSSQPISTRRASDVEQQHVRVHSSPRGSSKSTFNKSTINSSFIGRGQERLNEHRRRHKLEMQQGFAGLGGVPMSRGKLVSAAAAMGAAALVMGHAGVATAATEVRVCSAGHGINSGAAWIDNAVSLVCAWWAVPRGEWLLLCF